MYDIVYFSNVSGNTKRFVSKLNYNLIQIPLKWDDELPLLIDKEYVIVVPTYGGGADSKTVPKPVIKFLNGWISMKRFERGAFFYFTEPNTFHFV